MPKSRIFAGRSRLAVGRSVILRHIESLGYVIKVFTIDDTAEIHAVPLTGDREPQVVPCNDGDGPEEQYRAACLLARAVGVRLEDG